VNDNNLNLAYVEACKASYQTQNSELHNSPLKCVDCGSREKTLYDETLGHLSALLENATLSDVVCEVGGKEFKLHKTILAARSPVFEKMFSNKLEETRSNRIKVPQVSIEAFEEVLRYFYAGKVPNMKKFAYELFQFAEKVVCR